MVTIIDLIQARLLKVGEDVVWLQRGENTVHVAQVLVDGKLKTSDGVVHKTPSGAAKHIVKRPVDGWNVWKFHGQSLAKLRDEFLTS